VYDVSTVEQLTALFESIATCLDGWDLNHKIDKARAFIEKEPTEMRCIQAIRHLLDAAQIGSHEQFENGTGFDTLREKAQ
jgi:hypothetical protein